MRSCRNPCGTRPDPIQSGQVVRRRIEGAGIILRALLPGRANHRVACPAPIAKIFSFSSAANHFTVLRYPASQEGRIAIVTDVGRGMRWTRHVKRRMTLRADGEVVWS